VFYELISTHLALKGLSAQREFVLWRNCH